MRLLACLAAPFLPLRGCLAALERLPPPRWNGCACGARLLRPNCPRKALEARHRLALLALHRNPRPLARLALVPLLGHPCRALLPCPRRARLRRVLHRLAWRPRFHLPRLPLLCRNPRLPRRARLRRPCLPMKWCRRPARRGGVAWEAKPHKPDLPRQPRQTLRLWQPRNGLALRNIYSLIM